MSYKVVRLAHAGKRNRYLAATGIAFIGYVLFLSSALWFPGQKKIHGVHPTWNPAGNWGNHMYGIGGVLGICTGAGSNVG